jgi:assimilatory nitrate reductase catalytic subunit
MAEVRSTCPYCGVGCGVVIETNQGQISGVRGDPDHPANFGKLCSKGHTLHHTVGGHARALYPELRAHRALPRQRTTWQHALQHAAQQFAQIIQSDGPDAVAFYISGQLLTEDYYAFNKLARAVIGTNNIDSNSRLCMSSAVAGYKASLGADIPPTCYADIEAADCIFIIGSNMAWAHPILFRRLEDAKKNNPNLNIIVVDPRRTATVEIADLHLAIQPGTDVALLLGMIQVLIKDQRIATEFIHQHTDGFAELQQLAADYPLELSADICGINPADLVRAAHLFSQSKATLSLYCMGLNQSSCGTDKNTALINLHLATAQIGRIGAGPFSLTGQPNAMGGREVGAMANLLIAHRQLNNADDRAEVARGWGVPTLSAETGLTAIDMFQALQSKKIKAIWIACTNPAQSMPNQAVVREALAHAQLVVLQETYTNTDTAAYADILLPAAGWGEKTGTVTNSERRITRVRAATPPPGEALPDWQIVTKFAQALMTHQPTIRQCDFNFDSAEAVFNEYRNFTKGRNTDISDLSYSTLDHHGPQQWPYRSAKGNGDCTGSGTARLYLDHQFATPNGRAQFFSKPYQPVAEEIQSRYPIRLITGRLRDQWHGMSRTGRVSQLWGHAPIPYIALHPKALKRYLLTEGDVVHVESRRGELYIKVIADDSLVIGQAFLPMHWGGQFLAGMGSNALTTNAYDPSSFQPELKHCAVRISKPALPWSLVAVGTPEDANPQRLQSALQAYLHEFSYAHCTLTACGKGVMFHAANTSAPSALTLDAIQRLFNLTDSNTMQYVDTSRSIHRRLRFDDTHIGALYLAGNTQGAAWLSEFYQQNIAVMALGYQLLAPNAQPPATLSATDLQRKVICSCWSVNTQQINAALTTTSATPDNPSAQLITVQQQLQCGTLCGSCLPELRQYIKQFNLITNNSISKNSISHNSI